MIQTSMKVSEVISKYMAQIGSVGGTKASSKDKSRAGKLGAAARMRTLNLRKQQATTN